MEGVTEALGQQELKYDKIVTSENCLYKIYFTSLGQGVTITSPPSELPTSSSPQPSHSNPPAYPYNIVHTSFSLSSATGNRNASISPINTGPYDNVSKL